MSAAAVESLLARLYTDPALLKAFLQAPVETARTMGLDEEESRRVARIDARDLQLAAASYARKREQHTGKRRRVPVILTLLRKL